MEITLFLCVQILFAIFGPFVVYAAFKVAQEEARKAYFDEDTGAGCMLVIVIMLYAVNIISLGTQIYEGVIK